MQSIHLSDKTANHLRQMVALRGLDADTYAEELLAISLAVLRAGFAASPGKPYHALEFSGIAPTGRTAAEIDADIESDRAEWDAELAGISPKEPASE